MRPTLLGSLLDAARHNAPATAPTSRCSSRAPSTGPAATAAPLADEHHAPRRCSLSGALGAAARGAASARGGLLRRQGAPRGPARALPRRLVASQPASWPFLHPGRSAAVLAALLRASGGHSASWASCTRWWPARWDLERTAVFASTSTGSPRARRRVERFRPSAPSPRCARTSRYAARGGPAAELLARVREAAGEMLERGARVRRLQRRRRWGRAGARWRSRCPSARPSARSPTRTSRPLREQIVAALEELGGELRG